MTRPLSEDARWRVDCSDCVQWMNGLPRDYFDLLIGSPPYVDARFYGRDDVARDCPTWVEWMLEVSEAAVRVSKGLVLWVVSGVQRDKVYWPACEGLMWEWWKRGHHLWRPCIWHKVDDSGGGTAVPGGGGRQWFRNDWEYVLAFKKEGWLPFANNTAMGKEPVYDRVGGEMSNRTADGRRINDESYNYKKNADPWKTQSRGSGGAGGQNQDGTKKIGSKAGRSRRANGEMKDNSKRPMPELTNPGNFLDVHYTTEEVHALLDRLGVSPEQRSGIVNARVGGGHMGDRMCSLNEAPYPEALVNFFVQSFTQPNHLVGDCYSGSGTTAKVAIANSRRFHGCDLRQSQCDLTERRLEMVTPLDLFNPPLE